MNSWTWTNADLKCGPKCRRRSSSSRGSKGYMDGDVKVNGLNQNIWWSRLGVVIQCRIMVMANCLCYVPHVCVLVATSQSGYSKTSLLPLLPIPPLPLVFQLKHDLLYYFPPLFFLVYCHASRMLLIYLHLICSYSWHHLYSLLWTPFISLQASPPPSCLYTWQARNFNYMFFFFRFFRSFDAHVQILLSFYWKVCRLLFSLVYLTAGMLVLHDLSSSPNMLSSLIISII